MEDKSIFGKSQPQDISDPLRNFIEALVEEVVKEGKPFDATKKKWLRKYSENEGLDYEKLEKNLTDFFETVEELKHHESKACERLAMNLGKDCYLSEETVDKLMASMNEARAKEEAERKAKEEAARKAKEEAERKAREEAARKAREEAERKAREEAARKAKEEAERKAREEAARKAREEAERKAERVAEQAMWNQCKEIYTKESFQQYLNRYPYGAFAANAYDEISQIELRQKEADGIRKEQAEQERKEYLAEQNMWKQCRTKYDYQQYLNKYPHGMYASSAYNKISHAENEEKAQEEKLRQKESHSVKERQKTEKKQRIWIILAIIVLFVVSRLYLYNTNLGGVLVLICCGLYVLLVLAYAKRFLWKFIIIWVGLSVFFLIWAGLQWPILLLTGGMSFMASFGDL